MNQASSGVKASAAASQWRIQEARRERSYDRIVSELTSTRGAPERPLPLIWSKLSPPVSRGRVSRRRLLDVLCGSSRRMTLIRAPAGWGKSTLLADWQAAASEPRPFAWLALDEQDNDPVRFWTYAIESLRTVVPEIGESSLALTRTPGLNLTDVLVPVLVNELATSQVDVVFVLDDYHLITHDGIHQGLFSFVRHAPTQLELVVSTRVEPPFSLARLRASGDLVEVDAGGLSFSVAEATELLNDLHGLALEQDAVVRLRERTEGWAAGLYLAALSLRAHDDASEFVSAFAGDDRNVVDYLSEEVLATQPDEIRTFLLRTSILDRLCASLCDAVTGGSTSAAALDRIARSNFFLVPLDTRREWYRYHHLFGELLRHELDATESDLVPELHRRASTWLLDAGFPSEAIHHAVAAGDVEGATELVVTYWLEFRDEHRLETIFAWLEALPHRVVVQDPRLSLVKAATLLELGLVDESTVALDAAQRRTGHPTRAEAWVEAGALANRAIVHYLNGDVGCMRDAARPVLDRYVSSAPYWQCVLLTIDGTALFLSGRSRDASETLERAAGMAEETAHTFAQAHALGWKAAAHAEVGEWDEARGALERLEAMLVERPHLREYYGTALSWVVRGRLFELDGRAADADAAVRRGAELAAHSGSLLQLTFALLAAADVKQALGDRDGALVALREARQSLDACVDPAGLADIAARLTGRIVRSGATDGVGLDALSARELQVARLVSLGRTNPEIAAELFLSVKTIESHLRHIFQKLAVSSRADVARALRAKEAARTTRIAPR